MTFKSILLTGAAAVALAIAPAAVSNLSGLDAGAAKAAQGEGQKQMRKGQGGGGGAGGQGMQGEGRGGSGSSMEEEVMRGKGRDSMEAADEDGEEDSDRPDWAGRDATGEKPGGGNKGATTDKGDSYGDLWVILRNDDGTPDLKDGMVQVVLSDGTVIALADYDGELPEEYADQVQEVEFGRLNVARAPSKVIEHSLTEALSKLDGLTVTSDNLMEVTDPAGRLISLIDDSTIDSPLENLAIYKALLEATASDPVDGVYTLSIDVTPEGGAETTLTLSVQEDVLPTLAASALAAASDKTGTLTIDEVYYISGFMGVEDELSALVESFSYDDRDPDSSIFNRDVTILEQQGDIYVPVTVNLLDGSVSFNALPEIDADSNGIDDFAQNADDAVQVLEYVHDNALDAEVSPTQ